MLLDALVAWVARTCVRDGAFVEWAAPSLLTLINTCPQLLALNHDISVWRVGVVQESDALCLQQRIFSAYSSQAAPYYQKGGRYTLQITFADIK